MRHFYDVGLPEGATDISTLSFCALVVCGFLTGIGGNGGLTSATNSTAKNFPDRLVRAGVLTSCVGSRMLQRATTVGLVISGFGLSAFLFSTTAHVIFPGNTSEFLLVLAIGTSLPMILGFFFVRPIPLPHSDYIRLGETPDAIEEEDEFSSSSPVVFQRENNSHTHLLGAHADDDGFLDEDHLDSSFERRHGHESSPTDYVVPPSRGALALSPTRPEGGRHRSRSSLAGTRVWPGYGDDKVLDGPPNIRGTALASSGSFWLLFVIASLCECLSSTWSKQADSRWRSVSGTGLMCKESHLQTSSLD